MTKPKINRHCITSPIGGHSKKDGHLIDREIITLVNEDGSVHTTFRDEDLSSIDLGTIDMYDIVELQKAGIMPSNIHVGYNTGLEVDAVAMDGATQIISSVDADETNYQNENND